MSARRLGEPLELPWWVVPLALPPAAATILALVLGAPLWAHAVEVGASALTIAALVVIATRVSSRNMQSVWTSALYAAWVFTTVAWIVVVITTPTCRCT